MALDEVSGGVSPCRIERTHVNPHAGDMVELRTDAGTQSIHATGGHPFLVVSAPDAEDLRSGLLYAGRPEGTPGRWIQARDIRVGDQLRLVSGAGVATVTALRPYGARLAVYNLTVEHAHTYAVGAEWCVVHNDGCLHGHHSDPKFMGGDPRQKLTYLHSATHKQLHRDLNDFLVTKKDAFGNHMRPQAGNSGIRIQDNFLESERCAAMAGFYMVYGDKYPSAAVDFFNQPPSLK